MAITVKRSLYIGLGGTGMKSILQAKKRFMDTYGEVPPMVSFLGFDADKQEFNSTLTDIKGKPVTLSPSEKMGLFVNNASAFYTVNKKDFNWLPDCNVGFLGSLKNHGCGAIRTNGHFALSVNVVNIENVIRKSLTDIANAHIIANTKYAIDPSIPEIHLVFSVCGGTGSGTFINMAYLIRKTANAMGLNNIKLRGYVVLPGIFAGLPVTPRTQPNAFKALCDLDYLMHAEGDDAIYHASYIGGQVDKCMGRPFESVILIDNKTSIGGYNITNIKDLTEMVGIALTTSAGSLDGANDSIGDNLDSLIFAKAMDVADKRGWVAGMGACEIIYNGSTLSEIYQLKAQCALIDSLKFAQCEDANILANQWIDSIRIRENHNENHITDYIHEPAVETQCSISNRKNPKNEIEATKNFNKIKEEDIKKAVDQKVEDVKGALREFITKYISRDCGLHLTKSIIIQLKLQMAECQKEMYDEKEDLSKALESKENYITSCMDSLKAAMDGWFNAKEREACTEALNNAVDEYNLCSIDIQRHSGAITFYTSILNELDAMAKKLDKIDDCLFTIKSKLVEKIVQLQNGANNINPLLQIDLAYDQCKEMVVNAVEVSIEGLLKTIDGRAILLDFDQLPEVTIIKYLKEYTAGLPKCKEFLGRSVESILSDLKANDRERFDSIISRANAMSDIMLTYNPGGHKLPMLAPRITYIGVENDKSSCLNDNDVHNIFCQNPGTLEAPSVTMVSTNMKERVMIYQQLGVFPLFMVPALKTYKTQMNILSSSIHAFKNEYGFDFDKDLAIAKKDAIYSPDPTIVDPEPVWNSLELWIKGFIFGRIKNEKGKYYMISEETGSYSEGFWVELKEWRHEAFQIFEDNIKSCGPELENFLTKLEADKGSEYIHQCIDAAKDNYHAISQIKISMETLRTKPYVSVRKLFDMEGRYLKKM